MKILKLLPENQLDPELMSVGINLNVFPYSISASRQYMLGNNAGKSVRIKHPSPRRIMTGFEVEYGNAARQIIAPSNMTVEKVVYRRHQQPNGKLMDDWAEIYVIFFNEELQKYDLLVLPKYNTQNSYVAWEYRYDKDMLRRLNQDNATFRKGEIFARSPGVNDDGVWEFGVEANVCGLTVDYTEEDGIGVVDDFLATLGTIFEHKFGFSFMESEWVPLNLYGTLDNPRALPENGEMIRPDGIVMGFRRRDETSALVGMTKKGLMRPDEVYDKLFYAPPGCVVSDVQVTTERYKNKSHNKKEEKPIFSFTQQLEDYSEISNKMANEVKDWTKRLEARYRDSRLPVTPPLWDFCFKQFGEVVKDFAKGKFNIVKNAHRYKTKLDWNIEITLKEEVPAEKRFKLTCTHGGKGVIVKIIPAASAPRYPDGRRADIVINNTPAFRRQIFSSLMEAYVNLVNMDVYDRVKRLVQEPKGYQKAWNELIKFYGTVSENFKECALAAFPTEEEQSDHVDHVLRKEMISVHVRSDEKVYGIELVRRIKEAFPDVKPQPVTYINDFGQQVTTRESVVLSSMYYMLLNKFGTDMSGISMPSRNLFGLPSKLSPSDRNSSWHRAQPGRNVGEPDGRNRKTQLGGEEHVRTMIAATSPDVALKMASRIIRADNPLDIKEIIRPNELTKNRSLHMTMHAIRDAGYNLREENPDDLTS